MSTINFKCSVEEQENVKKLFWNILYEHYMNTVFPNTNIEYKDEGKEIYSNRMKELMEAELYKVEDTEDCVEIEFDSTENAGFLIADHVYKTNMGYNDQGLTFLKPIFDELIKQMPNICFEAQCECYDNWVSEEYSCSYDGQYFECDAEWMEDEEF